MSIPVVIALWFAACGIGFLIAGGMVLISFAKMGNGQAGTPNVILFCSTGLGFLLLANGAMLYQIIEKLTK